MRIRLTSKRKRGGIALVIVMISIFVLTILAAGFAYSMKVETRLAMHANNESELQWLGRSGVEWAKWILAQQLMINTEPYDSRDQIWAGGAGGMGTSNSPLANLPDEIKLGAGVIKRPRIVDLESKWNINTCGEMILTRALLNMGVEGSESTAVVNSILDWIDRDEQTRIEGAESEVYENFEPPYSAKNGPIDDISELLFIRGVTEQMYLGLSATNFQTGAFMQKRNRFGANDQVPLFSAGLKDLFTPISSGRININTASAEVLMVIPGMDEQLAQMVVSARSGSDDGNPMSMTGPFKNLTPNYLWAKVQGLSLEAARSLQQFCDVRSRTFMVEVDVELGGSKRTFHAILGRSNPRDVQLLSFYWES